MEIWKAIVLGVLQGLTEFLPVSSSGHLVLFQSILDVDASGVSFDVAVHLGTALAVAFYFRKHLWEMAKNLKLLTLLVIASLPAAVVGITLEDFLEGLFSSVTLVGVTLLITGLILWYAENATTQNRNSKGLERASYLDALIIGFGQALAIIPGISRSGSTIAVGLFRGLKREIAAEFSFLMSLPVILGAGLLQLKDLDALGEEIAPMIIGASAAFISGLAAIYFLLAIIRKHSLKIFSYYTWGLGALILILSLL